MTQIDEPFWNLAQAAAWVVYREKKLVDDLGNADTDSYAAIAMYPTFWPDHRKPHGKLSGLHYALSDGRLEAKGCHTDKPNERVAIPSDYWPDLNLHPPKAYGIRYPSNKYEPWIKIRVNSADVKKLWRGTDERLGRTKFDWDKIKLIYEDVLRRNQEFSQNKLIEEIQLEYQIRYPGESPSRSTIQNKIKIWR